MFMHELRVAMKLVHELMLRALGCHRKRHTSRRRGTAEVITLAAPQNTKRGQKSLMRKKKIHAARRRRSLRNSASARAVWEREARTKSSGDP